MTQALVCWKCGADLSALTLPLSRRDECKRCRAELHVCRLCIDFEPGLAKQCREPTAEEVHNKSAANFCDFFQPRANAHVASDSSATERARAELDRLFGNKG